MTKKAGIVYEVLDFCAENCQYSHYYLTYWKSKGQIEFLTIERPKQGLINFKVSAKSEPGERRY